MNVCPEWFIHASGSNGLHNLFRGMCACVSIILVDAVNVKCGQSKSIMDPYHSMLSLHTMRFRRMDLCVASDIYWFLLSYACIHITQKPKAVISIFAKCVREHKGVN